MRNSKLITGIFMAFLFATPTSAVTLITVADVHLAATNQGRSPFIKIDSSTKALVRFSAFQVFSENITPNHIVKATLFLYTNQITSGGKLQIRPTNSNNWGEFSVTLANAPPLGLPVATTPAILTTNRYSPIDVTLALRDWRASNKPFFDLAFEADPSTPTVSVLLDSKESTNTNHPAFIEVILSGPAGEQGPAGPQGPIGVAGPQGLAGVKGDTGAQGPNGPQGLQGLTGAKGDTGAQGPVGPQGATGPAVRTSSVCVDGNRNTGSTYSPSQCICSVRTISKVQGPCTSTSDTGSCTSHSISGDISFSLIDGTCCVCSP